MAHQVRDVLRSRRPAAGAPGKRKLKRGLLRLNDLRADSNADANANPAALAEHLATEHSCDHYGARGALARIDTW